MWLGGWNPVCSFSGRVEGGTGTQGSHDSSGVDEWKASSVLPCPFQGELESSRGRVSGLLSVLPMHKAWGSGIKCLFLPEILGRAWPVLSSGFSPLYHLCRELFLLAQSTVTAPLKYDLRSLDLIQFHLQRFFFPSMSQLVLIFIFTRLRRASLLGSRALVGLVHYCSVPPDTRVKLKNDLLKESMNQCTWNNVDKICTWENLGNREWRQNMGRIVYILGKIRPPGDATRKTQKGTDLILQVEWDLEGHERWPCELEVAKAWRDRGYQSTWYQPTRLSVLMPRGLQLQISKTRLITKQGKGVQHFHII